MGAAFRHGCWLQSTTKKKTTSGGSCSALVGANVGVARWTVVVGAPGALGAVQAASTGPKAARKRSLNENAPRMLRNQYRTWLTR